MMIQEHDRFWEAMTRNVSEAGQRRADPFADALRSFEGNLKVAQDFLRDQLGKKIDLIEYDEYSKNPTRPAEREVELGVHADHTVEYRRSYPLQRNARNKMNQVRGELRNEVETLTHRLVQGGK